MVRVLARWTCLALASLPLAAGAAPQIDSIDPSAITEGEASAFVVAGTGFEDGADLFIGALRVIPIDVTSDTAIDGMFPGTLEPGQYDVCVTNPDGAEDCLAEGLEVLTESGCNSCATGRGRSGGLLVTAALATAVALRRRRR